MIFLDTDLEGEPEESEFVTRAEMDELVETEAGSAIGSYSSQDFDVDGLVRRLKNDDILVPQFGHSDNRIESAGFQRGFVWKRPQMDRFVESLLLGYPVPGIFLVRQRDKRYLVLDGQQRLKTLQYFVRGTYSGREFALTNVAERFRGLTYDSLGEELRRTLDNSFIQATIVETDGTSASLDAVYQLFERLNSGGTQLTAHEIRVALYAGPFVDLLERLNQDKNWRAVYGRRSPRVRDQELILRILALKQAAGEYFRPLKGFLNKFVADNRESPASLSPAAELFVRACEVLATGPERRSLRFASEQVNAAKSEAVFVGLMTALESDIAISGKTAITAVTDLDENKEFLRAISGSTSNEEYVRIRLQLGKEAFERVPRA